MKLCGAICHRRGREDRLKGEWKKCLRRSDYTLAEMIFKEIWVAVLEGFGQFDIGDLILLFEVGDGESGFEQMQVGAGGEVDFVGDDLQIFLGGGGEPEVFMDVLTGEVGVTGDFGMLEAVVLE